MFEKCGVCRALGLGFGSALALGSTVALAQPQVQLEAVEVTGSSIKRINAESALPVVVLRREEIARTGATSVVDLMNRLPLVQNTTVESTAVGAVTFGFAGISLHNLGESRTLVLLNGHRLTQFGGQDLQGGQAAVDLNAIPLSAIERIEILSDGASALYGADAIGGVVNFITKRDVTEGDVTIGFSSPKGGAREKRISATKGFGSMQDDGYNVMLSFGHDERTALVATSRSYASTGQLYFGANGKSYRFQNLSASSIPANVTDDTFTLINPYQRLNGTCAPKSFRVVDAGGNDYCGYDYISDQEIYPERKRDNFMGSINKQLGDHQLFLDLLASRTTEIDRVAPAAGSFFIIPAGSALHDRYLLPTGITGDSFGFYRVSDLGKRVGDNTSKFYDLALGSRGVLAGWDYKAAVTQSQSDVRNNISGSPGALAIGRLLESGLLDPFVLPGQQSAAGQAALNGTNYTGYFTGGVAKLLTAQLSGSRSLAELPAGSLLLGAGVNFNRESFRSKPSLFAQGRLADPVAGTLCDPTSPDPLLACDLRFDVPGAFQPYDVSRNSFGTFAELIIPATKSLEFGLAARYDHYSDFGSATTAKGSFRWTPTRSLLLRGSIGTGFRAPTVPQVNAPRQPFGLTSGFYDCTAELQAQATAQGATCRPDGSQYDLVAGGNKDLQPEKSRQATIGIRVEPAAWLSAGADLWHVQIRNTVGQLNEQVVFNNPSLFAGSFTTVQDTASGTKLLAFLNENRNLGKSYSTGLDFDVSARNRVGWGDLTSQLLLTYMIREDRQLQPGGPYFSSIGNYAELGSVTFRWKGRWQTTLKTGNWINTLGINFKSGYNDQLTTVEVLDAAGNVTGSEDIRLRVPTYYTMDLQSQWTPIKNFFVTFGVLNVFDRDPPLSLAISGINKGFVFGYDDRYYDPRGRTFYLNATYKF
jgi:iron complex outermembrane receptor protein